MSYAADHLAWKQRVLKEQTAQKDGTMMWPLGLQAEDVMNQALAEQYVRTDARSDPHNMSNYDFKAALKNMTSIK